MLCLDTEYIQCATDTGTCKVDGVGMALNEATLPLILYRRAKTSEHVNVRTSCHISIPCFITFSASAIPTPFSFLMFFYL